LSRFNAKILLKRQLL